MTPETTTDQQQPQTGEMLAAGWGIKRREPKSAANWAFDYVDQLLAALERAQQEIGTWHKIWNDVDLLAGRVEAMRDGTADLGEAGAFRLGRPVPPESGQAQRGQGQ